MNKLVLGLGDHGFIKNAEGELKTFALGSCVAVILIDQKSHIISMAHVVLPDSKVDPKKSQEKPGHFADTAIPMLLDGMKQLGSKDKIIAKLVGGASIKMAVDTFQIGKRNGLAVKKLLWKYRVGVFAEEMGGTISRTVSVDTAGVVTISTPNMENRSF